MKTEVKTGEIWKLGDHVLGCGSSTDKGFVGKVLSHAGKVKVVLTDPPYGVAYVENKEGFLKLSSEGGKARKIENDQEQTEEQYATFTTAWIEAIKPHLDPYNQFYIFGTDLMIRALRNAMDVTGLYYSQMLIWVKNSVVPGRKDYLPQHEIIAYGWYGKHKMQRAKGKSILFHPKPGASALHPTMKPPGLLRQIIPNGAAVGEWVYDAFGGSGSTLIACEHLKRRAVIVELDQTYAETIIARWEKLSGAKAERLQ